jgi:RHS repeat-associated protein
MATVSPKGNVPGGTPADFTTTVTRNNYGQVLTTKDPLWSSSTPVAHIVTNVYDANGQRTSTTDGDGNTTAVSYDAAGQVTTVSRPDSSSEQQAYYADGSLQSQTDGRGKVTTYAYDSLGSLTAMADALGRVTSYVSDLAGNVTNRIDPGGVCAGTPSGCTTFSYDAVNRTTAISYSDGVTPAVTFGYDNVGRRTAMTDGSGSSTYVYDTLGRLTSHGNGAGQTVGYGYDRTGNVTQITYPGSNVVNRSYDQANRFTSVSDWLGNKTQFTYDPNSNLTSTLFANGLASVNSFDEADQLMAINVGKGAKATFSYSRSGNGLLSATTATGVTPTAETFGYDVNNRINTYNANTLSHDNANNVTTMTNGATLAYDDASQITTKTVGGVPTTYTFDTRGNRTTAGSTTYGYDQDSRLTDFNGVATYEYDGDGLRTEKTVSSTTSAFVYDVAEGMSQILRDGTNSYVYGPGGVAVSQITGTTVTNLQQDQLGSTRVLTDAGRNVVGTYSYDVYGTTTSHTGSASTPLQFAGQYLDDESSTYWMRARYYDPNTASFLTKDPLVTQTRLPYGYVYGNPVNATDPSGLFWGEGTLNKGASLIVDHAPNDFVLGSAVVHDTLFGGSVQADWNACVSGGIGVSIGYCQNLTGLQPTNGSKTVGFGLGAGVGADFGAGNFQPDSFSAGICYGGGIGIAVSPDEVGNSSAYSPSLSIGGKGYGFQYSGTPEAWWQRYPEVSGVIADAHSGMGE